MKKRIRIIKEFEDKLNGQTYLVGGIFLAPEEVAKRFVLRGDAEWIDGEKTNTTIGFIKHPKVSIVILVKDALDYVKKCIESLIKYTEDFELIIIDNDSSSQTKKYLAGINYPDYTLITNPKNKGVGYGWNQGIKVSKYNYICFLNSDTLLSNNWLGKLIKGFKYSPDVGIAGPSTCYSATIQSPQVFRAFRNADQDKVNTIAAMLKEDYIETPVVGFCFVIAKKVFDKIGAFDYKRYGIACGEDMDLIWRAMKAGFKSIWCRDSYVHHFGNCTTKEMGLNPHAMRVKNTPILNERMKDITNLYIENDVEIPKFKQIEADKTDVIMATLDREVETTRTLSSLFKNNKNINVIVVDNGSDDLDYLKKFDVKVIANKENAGAIKALNQGIGLAKSKYIVVMHNDIAIDNNGWIASAIKFMEANPDAGIVGTSGWLEIKSNGSHNDIVSGIAVYGYKFKSDFVEVAVTDGQCNVIRNIGLTFDEKYGFTHFYDKDLSFQYRSKGYKVYVMKAKVNHFADDGKLSTVESQKYKSKINDTQLKSENKKKFIDKWKDIIPVKIAGNDLIPILMITYNRLPYTKKAIKALLENTKNCKISIFDNNSTDGTQEYLTSIKDERIILHFNKENEGIIKPKNIFLDKYKNSKYVAFVDNDCIVPKGWLRALKAVMDKFPLLAVQLEHYVGLGWDFKKNIDWFKHLYHIDFNGHNLYLNNFVGGGGTLVRRSYITGPIPEAKGTLLGWGNYIRDRFNEDRLISGFYDGLFMKLCDMSGTNKKNYDFPGYKEELNNLGRGEFGLQEFSKADEQYYEKLRNIIDDIVKSWNICSG
ncbi:MAG: hypothetical protein A2163_09755 [Actinobacteria bacterium RBG_13_35_12]|nr:MAG: hypothetical protein A2163_09755 [Actinobacteria bacterium RBG_13_35_12]